MLEKDAVRSVVSELASILTLKIQIPPNREIEIYLPRVPPRMRSLLIVSPWWIRRFELQVSGAGTYQIMFKP